MRRRGMRVLLALLLAFGGVSTAACGYDGGSGQEDTGGAGGGGGY